MLRRSISAPSPGTPGEGWGVWDAVLLITALLARYEKLDVGYAHRCCGIERGSKTPVGSARPA